MAIGGLGGKYISKFSPECSKVGICRPDGCLAIYSGGVGGGCKLLHQFSPSTHLTALPTCLAWAGRHQQGRKKKKKKSQENIPEENISDLVAMGTAAGTVLVYSTMQGNMVTSLKTENNTRINSLVWTKSCSTIYAGGEDGSVSLFSIPQQSLVTTFTHSSEPVHSLALNRKENLLAMGSRKVHVWDIPNNKVINTFTGHANPVTRLEIVNNFLFSSSESERVVSVWSLDTSSTSTLRVNANVADMSVHTEEDDQISIGVLTTEGVMAVLTCSQTADKSSLVSQPLKTVRVKTGQGVTRTVTAVGMVKDKVSIAYGEGMDIAVEQMNIENLEQNTSLVREKVVVKSGQSESVTDVVTPKTDGQVVFLAPGTSLSTGKRKAEKADDDSLPVEERISLLSTDPSTPSTTTTPRTDTLAQLLAQGLHSNDPRILDSVLDRADMELIDNTVKKIPAEAVVPLVTVLQKYIKGRGMVNASHAKWLKAVLTIHTGYLVSVPDCQELLTPLYALLETRTQHYSQVLQLRGKLELLTRQTMDRQGDTVVDTEKQALLVYQDESSDELEDVIDDLLVPGSDTDDDWEEKEDDEMEGGEDSDDSIEIVNGEEDDAMESESD